MTDFKPLFPQGDKNDAYADVFTGQSFLQILGKAPDQSFHIGNVTFEPGCRNNWHAHINGYQILLCTDGQGIYQEDGQAARHLHPGDVVVTEAGVKHWHGATEDSWFAHVAITAGTAEWYEPVSDKTFAAAQEKKD
ncbi:cupin domain-containing protein [Streptococcus pluranimalium]|uniref:cupin domain-containing protein n=1 Tax=Streptococcus pluranimalium TaxID=82348 RepID=UPI002A79415F|nr:cupin domain-containing protein [Streptococcus pluranimalium]